MPNLGLLLYLEAFEKFLVGGGGWWWVVEGKFSVQLRPKLNNIIYHIDNSNIKRVLYYIGKW